MSSSTTHSKTDNPCGTPLRRSQRIATRNSTKNASSMCVSPILIIQPNPQPTPGLSDKDLQRLEESMPAYPNDSPEIDTLLQEYQTLIEDVRRAVPTLMPTVRAIRKLMSFLLWNTALLDSLSDAHIQEIHGWMQSFRTAHDKWNQEFAENMMKAVRSNKDFFIDMEEKSYNPGAVMNALRQWKPYHNEIICTNIDVEVVYEHILHRL